MYAGRTVFSQLVDHLPMRRFQTLVQRYRGDYKNRGFTCRDQLLAMIFAQLTRCESLRDIHAAFAAQPTLRYHLGISAPVRRSTLRDANEKRDARIFEDFAKLLIVEARTLCAGEPMGVDIDATVYAFDSTTISLCFELFPWAKFRRRKAGIKLHTLIDLRGNIPSFILVSTAKTHDVLALDDLPVEPGAFYLLDKGYIDYKRLYTLHLSGAFFVTRVKDNAKYRVVASRPVEKETGLRCDQSIRLTGTKTSALYPQTLRRVKFRDPQTGDGYEFLTNNFLLPALVIAQLYKQRWQVELFFKWIKQHLRIKSFYGTSPNAVRVQIWTAITAYVLLAIVRKCMGLPQDLYSMTQILRLHLFAKTPVLSLFYETPEENRDSQSSNQLSLFE